MSAVRDKSSWGNVLNFIIRPVMSLSSGNIILNETCTSASREVNRRNLQNHRAMRGLDTAAAQVGGKTATSISKPVSLPQSLCVLTRLSSKHRLHRKLRPYIRHGWHFLLPDHHLKSLHISVFLSDMLIWEPRRPPGVKHDLNGLRLH